MLDFLGIINWWGLSGIERQTDTQTSEQSNKEGNNRTDEPGQEKREKREDGREIQMLMWLYKSHVSIRQQETATQRHKTDWELMFGLRGERGHRRGQRQEEEGEKERWRQTDGGRGKSKDLWMLYSRTQEAVVTTACLIGANYSSLFQSVSAWTNLFPQVSGHQRLKTGFTNDALPLLSNRCQRVDVHNSVANSVCLPCCTTQGPPCLPHIYKLLKPFEGNAVAAWFVFAGDPFFQFTKRNMILLHQSRRELCERMEGLQKTRDRIFCWSSLVSLGFGY